MLNGNEMKAFYRIFFPKRPDEGGLSARVPDVNETRLNDNFKIIGDEFRKIWEFIKNGFKTKSLTVDGDASVGGDLDVSGDASVGGSMSITGNAAITGDISADDVTVNGVLDIIKRRCENTLSSAGWYRAISFNIASSTSVKFAVSAIIDILIFSAYNNTNNMLHKISLAGTYNSVDFVDELSRGNTSPVIDKIRYTYGTDYKGHIDVHYSVSTSNSIGIMFDVKTRFGASLPSYFVPESLQSVDDAPSGETIMREYTFLANTDFGPTEFTPTSGT